MMYDRFVPQMVLLCSVFLLVLMSDEEVFPSGSSVVVMVWWRVTSRDLFIVIRWMNFGLLEVSMFAVTE